MGKDIVGKDGVGFVVRVYVLWEGESTCGKRGVKMENIVGLKLGKWTVQSLSGQKVTLADGSEITTMSLGRFNAYLKKQMEEE